MKRYVASARHADMMIRCISFANRKSLPLLPRALCTSSESPKIQTTKTNRLVLYSQLAKFRLSSLVVLTSGAGYLCYGATVDPITLAGEGVQVQLAD